MLVAGCGDTDTTVINQTTSVAAPTTSGATSSTTSTVAPTTPTPPDVAVPDQDLKGEGPQDYSGPCGEPGAVTGGSPGSSATTATPGFTGLEVRHESCTFATTVASGFIGQWESSCASGCNHRIEATTCNYGGSGTPVVCKGAAETEVTFSLVFPLE